VLPPWLIVAAGMAVQACLGSAYAWSWFQQPIREACGWSNSTTTWAFSTAIACLGLAAAWAGPRLDRWGPHRVAMAGGALFAVGHLLAALALHRHDPLLLVLGYGVVGGCGLGLGYVAPVAAAARSAPERKGLATGLVIMGFGLGALLMAKVAAPLLHQAFAVGQADDAAGRRAVLAQVFLTLGLGFLVVIPALGALLRPPPVAVTAAAAGGWFGRRFALLWLVFFCNIAAGIALIGFLSPLYQGLLRRHGPAPDPAGLAAAGATLIALAALANGAGRPLWGALSDAIGRARTFRVLLAVQVAAFAALAATGEPWLFALLVGVVMLGYGGGFGTMPSAVLDAFGPRRMAAAYGAMLTAWSAAGVAGPQLTALLADRWPEQAGHYAALLGLGFTALGFAVSLRLRDGAEPD
jgi:OFA family oxalate/formate antiporter-like MFS transporter